MKPSERRWLSSGYLAAKPKGKIDHENGIIEGVSVNTEGEAKGHDVWLDEEFVDTVIEFGNAKKQGLKARFGHPNMCSTALGTFIGRFKNFRKETIERDDGQTANRAVADLFLSNEAKATPHGNLYDYVLGMAENEADMFGTSIVFTPGDVYRRTKDGEKAYRKTHESWAEGTVEIWYEFADGEKVEDEGGLSDEIYVECDELHACDCVDDPAANDGMFSAFSRETIAGQITEFFDLHPQVLNSLTDNPKIIEAISKYGTKIDEFIVQYQNYQEKKMSKLNTNDNLVDLEKLNQANENEDVETETVEEEAETSKNDETGTDENGAENESGESAETTEAETFDVAEFKRMKEMFGAEIAAEIVSSGGDEADGWKMRAEKAEKEKAELQKRVEAVEQNQNKGGTPAKASAETGKKKSIWS